MYWHVIRSSTSLSGGNIPQSQIDASIDVLNADYAGTGLSFTLAGTDFTTNSTWFQRADDCSGFSYQTAMKRALRQGGANALNYALVGTVGVVIIALVLDWLILLLQRLVVSKGIRV